MKTLFPLENFPCYVAVKVIPNTSSTGIKEVMEDGTLKIRLHASAEKGKANRELIQFFKNAFDCNATIISGETDRKKLIRLDQKNEK